MNCYVVLGVDAAASDEEIRRAYRSRALSTHPDKHAGRAEEFHAVVAAYELLSDPDRRRAHDAQIGIGTGIGASTAGSRAAAADTQAMRDHFAAKLAENMRAAAPAAAAAAAAAQAPAGTKRSELSAWAEILRGMNPRTRSGREFTSVAEARAFVDANPGERLVMSYGGTLDETIDRCARRAMRESR